MNALIKKEIRLLLPAWIAAMLLAILPSWFTEIFYSNYTFSYIPGFCFVLGTIFLGISSFGQEVSFRTFSLLLSQPIARQKIWLVKTVALVLAFISVSLALFISWEIQFYYCGSPPEFWLRNDLKSLLLYILAIYSGGLWTTLLLRQTIGAFWFTLFMPLGVLIGVGSSLNNFIFSNRTINEIIAAGLLLYSISGFFWARRMFLTAQDTQWTGGEISFPWRKKSSEQTAASFSSQPRHWFSALARKEFQLHQGTILISGLVLALHLASVFIRKVHPNFENPAYKDVLEFIWVLWLLMPLVIGSAAVAEERRLGVIESQLCLPVSRRAQLFTKFSIGLILSVILGALIPLAIEAPKHFTDHPHDFIFVFWIPAAAIFFISFYASTLARTTLQAIGLAIVVSAAIYFYQITTAIDILKFGYSDEQFGWELLKTFLSVSILFFVLVGLMIWNFKWLHENWQLWRRNSVLVFAAFTFIFVLTNAVYFRAWELLTPVEPVHGPARLTDSNSIKFASNGGSISAILPDGRLWINSLLFVYGNSRTAKTLTGTAQFINGSHWTEVAPQWYETLAIKSNGSLWNLQSKWNHARGLIPAKLTQMGSETNWSHVASGNYFFLLLKNDGSLWLWGTNRIKGLAKKLAADLATPPARIGDGTNWSGLFSPYARKSDGTFWTWSREWEGTNEVSHFIQNTNLNDQWLSFIPNDGYAVGIKTNGEFWFFSNPPPNWNWNGIPHYSRQVQLGQNAKWKAVTFVNNSMIALRSDGTLWKWSPVYRILNNPGFPALVKPVQLGIHSDWIVLSSKYYSGSIALAADGGLWLWDAPSAHIWLAPPRKPVFIGNIFQGTTVKE